MNFNELLTKYREAAQSKVQLGNTFERVVRRYLEIDPIYQGKFEKIWLWNAFPGRKSISKKDIGIDLVGLTKAGEYWAIQAKCYHEGNEINKKDVDTFLATSGMDFEIDKVAKKFAHRLFVSTTNKWSVHAEAVIRNQNPPLTRISLSDLENSDEEALKIYTQTIGNGFVNSNLKPIRLLIIYQDIQRFGVVTRIIIMLAFLVKNTCYFIATSIRLSLQSQKFQAPTTRPNLVEHVKQWCLAANK